MNSKKGEPDDNMSKDSPISFTLQRVEEIQPFFYTRCSELLYLYALKRNIE